MDTQANQPVETLLVDSAKSTERQRNQTHRHETTLPCIFCRGVHFNDNCDKFTTVTDRKHQLITQDRCFLCLKVGHPLKECPNAHSKPCYHCKKMVITIKAYVQKSLLFHLKHQLHLKQQLLIKHLLVPMIAANQLLLLNQQLIL